MIVPHFSLMNSDVASGQLCIYTRWTCIITVFLCRSILALWVVDVHVVLSWRVPPGPGHIGAIQQQHFGYTQPYFTGFYSLHHEQSSKASLQKLQGKNCCVRTAAAVSCLWLTCCARVRDCACQLLPPFVKQKGYMQLLWHTCGCSCTIDACRHAAIRYSSRCTCRRICEQREMHNEYVEGGVAHHVAAQHKARLVRHPMILLQCRSKPALLVVSLSWPASAQTSVKSYMVQMVVNHAVKRYM